MDDRALIAAALRRYAETEPARTLVPLRDVLSDPDATERQVAKAQDIRDRAQQRISRALALAEEYEQT